jgi:hypothetical protein
MNKYNKFFKNLINKKIKEANKYKKYGYNPYKAFIGAIFILFIIGCSRPPEPQNGTLRIEVEKIICINHNVYLVINGKNILVVDAYTQIGINCN